MTLKTLVSQTAFTSCNDALLARPIQSAAHTAFCSDGWEDIEGKEFHLRHVGGLYYMRNPKGLGSYVVAAYVIANP